MSNKYEAARWSEEDGWWNREDITIDDIVTRHNTSIIKLQGDHDEECEKLRHQLADASQALTYARQGKEAADAKVRRMSETIRRLGEKVKKQEQK